jgi:mono/diheme cytochrome c family protein
MERSIWTWLGGFAAAAWLWPGTPAGAEEADRVLAELGGALYATRCASCHGIDGKGEGPVAGALVAKPADLTRIAARRGGSFPTAEIGRFIDGRFEIVAHGSREMPVWGQRFAESFPEPGVGEEVARGNIASLVEYLKSIQRD